MTNTQKDRSREHLDYLIARLIDAGSQDLSMLVQLAELDPASSFMFGDWSGLDARGANIRGYDFRGALLENARFDRALIGAGIDVNGKMAPAANFDGAIVGRVSPESKLITIANISEAEDYEDYARSWLRSLQQGVGEAFEVGDVFRDAPFAPLLVVVPPGSVLGTHYTKDWKSALRDGLPGVRNDIGNIVARRGVQDSFDVFKVAVGVRPTTVNQWNKFAEETGKYPLTTSVASDPELPVASISWNQACEYVGWLTVRTGQQYRLISEPEFQHCLVADGPQLQLNTQPPSDLGHSDAPLKCNRWGICGLARNALEWCGDVWPPNDETRKDSELRGCRGANPDLLQDRGVAFRSLRRVDQAFASVGFRVARVLTD